MENKSQKCSSKDHMEIDAKSYCQMCQIYMCNKCDNTHLKLCPNHSPYDLNKDIKEIFTGICKEENHLNTLNYFCKNHNKLCWAACISKIKGHGNGQHTDCDVCYIEEIKDEKKNNLKKNIKILEDSTNTFVESINKLKDLFDIIENNKEDMKLKVQKIFTKLRNSLNEREDELLKEIDKIYDNIILNKEIIKEGENLPNKIKISLERAKMIEKDWDNNKLKSMVNDCINIENYIKFIYDIKEKLKKDNSINYEIKFIPEDNGIEEFLVKIKNFGNIYQCQNWIESNIILLPNDKEKLKNLIFPNININSKLLYRLSRDGETLNTFHQLCDNVKNNLVLIQTENNITFGCYCTWFWDTSGNDFNSNNEGILFNLTNNQQYSNQNLRLHRGCSSHGPYIHDNFYFDKSMRKCNILSKRYIEKTGYNIIKEVELYQIIESKND